MCWIWEEGCSPVEGIGQAVGDAVGDAVSGAVGEWLGGLADSIVEAVGSFVATLGTLWVTVPTPTIALDEVGTPSGTVGFIQDRLLWYVGALAVLSVIVGGMRMAWEQRAEPGRELLQSLLTLIVVSGAGLAVIGVATTAADQFSTWIIDESTSCDGLAAGETCFGRNITLMLGLAGTSGLGVVVMIVAASIALLASLIQIIMMLIRGGMLVVLAGVFPLTAAFTNTEMGKQWFKKALGWTIAFILYKPAAAIIYATAFRLTGSGVETASWEGVGNGLLRVLTGVMLMCMALVAMPALMRFVIPMVAAAGGANAGMMAAGAVAGAMSMPSGAMDVASKFGGGGGGSSGGPSGSSGAEPKGATGGATGAGAAGKTGGGAATGGAATGGGATGAAAGAAAGAATGGATLVVEGMKKVGEGIQKAASTISEAASDATGDGGPTGSG